jgi:hypothetical protein
MISVSKTPSPWGALALVAIVTFGVLAGLAYAQVPAPVPALPPGLDPQTVAFLQLLQQMQAQQASSTIAAPVAGGALSSLIAVFGGIMAIRQIAPMLLGAPLEDLKAKHAVHKTELRRLQRDLAEVRSFNAWMALCQGLIANKLGVELPPKPAPVSTEPDSQES